MNTCRYPGCSESVVSVCDGCNCGFCSDHGTPGGDREVEDVGLVAYPSACWNCWGFNADADLKSKAEGE